LFDSGVGGLSVYKEIRQLLPQHNYMYLYDNEAYPYGELSEQVLIERVINLICRFVKSKDIDLVVIACNTASTIALSQLRKVISVPVVGVVPAIKPACKLSKKAVGLLATPATIKRNYIESLIHEFSNNVPVKMLGSTLLVHMAEQKLRGKPIDIECLKREMLSLIERVDVVVLGCTHFPLIRNELSQVFGPEVKFVDSGQAIAKRVVGLLEKNRYQREKKIGKAYATLVDIHTETLMQCFANLDLETIGHFPYLKIWDH